MSAKLLTCSPRDLNLPSGLMVCIRRGRKEVLQSARLLTRFAERCGQPGAMSDLGYFLAKPGVLKRSPLLLLIGSGKALGELDREPDELLGALLLYEYRFAGLRTGLYTSNDRSGRNTLVAPAHLRSSLALFAARFLLEHKAHMMLLSFRDAGSNDAEGSQAMQLAKTRSSWAMRRREIPEFLPLAESYDLTLAGIGQRTRSNLRYYRRRAERELGCTFVPELEIDDAALLQFNRDCMYAVPDRVATWRLAATRDLERPLVMGMTDREGRLLSVLGGRRVGSSSEILWQMNRDGLSHLSLSLVMRSYFLEHEIGRGAKRFYIEGGTPHPIKESFTRETVTDLAVRRRSPTASLMRKLARHALQDGNELASMLFDPELSWSTAGAPRSREQASGGIHPRTAE